MTQDEIEAKKKENFRDQVSDFFLRNTLVKKTVWNLKKASTTEELSADIEINESKITTPPDFKNIFLLDQKDLIEWCIEIGFIKKPKYCNYCFNKSRKHVRYNFQKAKNYLDEYCFRCKDCKTKKSIRVGNRILEGFPKIKLKVLLAYIFTHFAFLIPAETSSRALHISLKTIRQLSRLLSEWIVEEQVGSENEAKKYGGENSIIEMDESCFFRRKNYKGRTTKNVWVFGFVQRCSGELFAEVVEKRDAKTLVSIIKKRIHKKTQLLLSDEWKAYQGLGRLGYNHKTIKHKANFVDPKNPQIHTQTIENRWGLMKILMRKRGKISRTLFDTRINPLITEKMCFRVVKCLTTDRINIWHIGLPGKNLRRHNGRKNRKKCREIFSANEKFSSKRLSNKQVFWTGALQKMK